MAINNVGRGFEARFSGKRVLVTGGAGFIGSNLCHALSALGAKVLAVDNLLEGGGGDPYNLQGAPVCLRLADLRQVDLAPLVSEVDVIFNLAACTGHLALGDDAELDLSINAAAQLRLILAVRCFAPKAVVVHASTRQIYGKPVYLPVDETHQIAPPDANAVSKFAGEQYWMLEHRSNARAVVSLRLSNCYGPRLRIKPGSQGFIGHWLRSALCGDPFELWNGEQLRDMAYIDDVIRALLAAASEPQCFGRIFNIGGSSPISLSELADLFVNVTAQRAAYIRKPFPQSRAQIDIGSYFADDTAFRTASGWQPRVTIEEGLRRTLNWFHACSGHYLGEESHHAL